MSDEDFQTYITERKSLVEAELEQSRLFDKAILTLAAGALGLSITFIRQIAPTPDPNTIWMLIVAWVAFSSSVLVTLTSFLTSQFACRRQRDILDAQQSDRTAGSCNGFGIATVILNVLSAILFVIGVGFMVVFSISNFSPPGVQS